MNPPVDIYVSLGSNINPASNIASARDELLTWLDNGKMSPVYQSAAVGMRGADFLNAVIGGRTTEPLGRIIDKLLAIEHEHGRVRTANKFTDRTLDLDLLLYGDVICNAESPEQVELPHQEITQQAYVLQPLADLAGTLVHPVHGRTINELCVSLKAEAPQMFQALSAVALQP